MALKVGVVGLRGIGTKHSQCYHDDDLAELVAVCDIVKERADTAADKFGVKKYYNLTDMLKNEDLDIVDVSTGGYENGGWHYEPVMEALEAGKHTIVEKPLSNEVTQAREMVAKAAEQKVYLACNLNHYFTPPAEKAREYMDNGEVGELLYCIHKMGFPGGERTYGGPAKDFRHAGFPYFHVKAFLSHPFGVMRYFCGDVMHVQAFMGQPGFRKAAQDPLVSVNGIHVRFANGCIGYLLSQRGDTTFGLGGWWSMEVGGTRGSFVIENCIEKLTYYPAPGAEGAAEPEKLGLGKSPEPIVTESGITDFGETFPRRIHAWLEDVTNKVPRDLLRSSARDALAALEYTWAAMESYEQGGIMVRPHPLPPLQSGPDEMEAQ